MNTRVETVSYFTEKELVKMYMYEQYMPTAEIVARIRDCNNDLQYVSVQELGIHNNELQFYIHEFHNAKDQSGMIQSLIHQGKLVPINMKKLSMLIKLGIFKMVGQYKA